MRPARDARGGLTAALGALLVAARPGIGMAHAKAVARIVRGHVDTRAGSTRLCAHARARKPGGNGSELSMT